MCLENIKMSQKQNKVSIWLCRNNDSNKLDGELCQLKDIRFSLNNSDDSKEIQPNILRAVDLDEVHFARVIR